MNAEPGRRPAGPGHRRRRCGGGAWYRADAMPAPASAAMTNKTAGATATALATTLGLAAACWVAAARLMTGMDMGVATGLGSFGFFLGVWVTMMAAMMLPGAAPAVVRRSRSHHGVRAVQWPGASLEAGASNVEQGGIAALLGFVDVPADRDLPCTEDPELFFAEAPADVEAAKALCRSCKIRAACLEGALERREPWGVWGGELLLRGTVVPRKRPRGRPRKQDAALAKADGQAA